MRTCSGGKLVCWSLAEVRAAAWRAEREEESRGEAEAAELGPERGVRRKEKEPKPGQSGEQEPPGLGKLAQLTEQVMEGGQSLAKLAGQGDVGLGGVGGHGQGGGEGGQGTGQLSSLSCLPGEPHTQSLESRENHCQNKATPLRRLNLEFTMNNGTTTSVSN